MAGFEDFFGGGGGSFALGLAPIKGSASMKDPGSTYPQSESAAFNPWNTDRGRLAPVADSDEAGLALNLRNVQDFSIARGRLADRNSVWAIDELHAGFTGTPQLAAMVYDSVGGFLYLYFRESVGSKMYLGRVDVVTGAVVTISEVLGVTAPTPRNIGSGYLNGTTLTMYTLAGNTLDKIEMTTAGVLVSAPTPAKVNAVTIRTSNWTTYVTADERVTASEFTAFASRAGGSASTFLRFVLTRGPCQKAVVIPFDGALPFAAGTPVVDVSGEGVGAGVSNALTMVTPWGADSVLFTANATSGATNAFLETYGRRIFDRIDFDRWLTEVADFYNMPTVGGAYWP